MDHLLALYALDNPSHISILQLYWNWIAKYGMSDFEDFQFGGVIQYYMFEIWEWSMQNMNVLWWMFLGKLDLKEQEENLAEGSKKWALNQLFVF